MIDAPGPWGTGPFILTEGHSVIDARQAVTSHDPFACIWLPTEDRTPRVRLMANTGYWDRRRGPRLQEVVFRNDLSPQEALEAVCTTEGEVDIVTEVPPAQAQRVERSEHAELVSVDAVHAIAGVFDRDASDVPLHDRRARQAVNLAVDREGLVQETMHGHARPLAGLTPPTALTVAHRFPRRLRPYPHDPALAGRLWAAAGGAAGQTLRIAALEGLEAVAHRVAHDVGAVLGLRAEVRALEGEEAAEARRALAEKDRPHPWHVLIVQQGMQSVDAPPLELHRAFVGSTGEYRAGPVVPVFEELYADLPRHTSQAGLVLQANAIDRFVREQSLALFLCAPDALYAVNRHVRFQPYATTFELAETEVDDGHWSVR
ncbi:MAG: ABC transporter substrate-binding protein [Actinomycetota bacterium]|nr:ABC transporter substrate-binding protein [Actinomycetota bacterium]